MISEPNIFRSITNYMIGSDIDRGLMVTKHLALVISTLCLLRALVNQIGWFVVSASAIYSPSYIEISIDYSFLEYKLIVVLLSQ
jgi:hypothetical protein